MLLMAGSDVAFEMTPKIGNPPFLAWEHTSQLECTDTSADQRIRIGYRIRYRYSSDTPPIRIAGVSENK